MEMTESSYYEGTINGENQAKSITLKLDSSSKIKLTGDSYVTSLEDSETSYSNIDFMDTHYTLMEQQQIKRIKTSPINIQM